RGSMQCARCGFENPEGMSFCGQCAALLNLRCPQCGFENPRGFTFCGQCAAPFPTSVALGHQVGTQPAPGKRRPKSSKRSRAKPQELRVQQHPQEAGCSASEAERWQLTILFCDVVGSTALSTRLDSEQLREVMQAYQRTCVAVITRFEGHVAKYLGDGLLVYFGYPTAHEDDAQRAVRAGLGMIEALQDVSLQNTRLGQP